MCAFSSPEGEVEIGHVISDFAHCVSDNYLEQTVLLSGEQRVKLVLKEEEGFYFTGFHSQHQACQQEACGGGQFDSIFLTSIQVPVLVQYLQQVWCSVVL